MKRFRALAAELQPQELISKKADRLGLVGIEPTTSGM